MGGTENGKVSRKQLMHEAKEWLWAESSRWIGGSAWWDMKPSSQRETLSIYSSIDAWLVYKTSTTLLSFSIVANAES